MRTVSANRFVLEPLSVGDAAYVAGLLDGEGTLTIGRVKKVQNRAGIRHLPIMNITNTNLAALESVQATCGGRLCRNYNTEKPGHKTCYVLKFNATQMRSLLPQLRPFLRMKHQQCDILLRWLNEIPRDGKNLSDEAWAQCELLVADIKRLNHRGTGEYQPPPSMIRPDHRGVNQWTTGQAVAARCQIEGCNTKHHSHGYCKKHHHEFVVGFKRYEQKCVVCDKEFTASRSDTQCCSHKCSDRHQYVKNREAKNVYKREWRAKRKSGTCESA